MSLLEFLQVFGFHGNPMRNETKSSNMNSMYTTDRKSIQFVTKKQSKMLLRNYGLSIVIDERVTDAIKRLSSQFKEIVPAGYYVSLAVGYDKRSNMYVALVAIYHIAKRYMNLSFPLAASDNLDSLLEEINKVDIYSFVPQFGS